MALHFLAAPTLRSRAVPFSLAGLGSRLALAISILLLMLGGAAPPRQLQVEQIATPYAFPIVDWHLARIHERLPRIELGFLGLRGAVGDADRAAVAEYFAAPASDRARLQPDAEAAIERAVSSVLLSEGLGSGAPVVPGDGLLFPPVSFAFVAPPEVLIVSPRDRVAVQQSELLQPKLSTAEAERIESSVDSLGYSSLVVPIGGLATFPTMVLEGTRPLDAVVAVTHEWIHGYLFFSPLGLRYWSSQDARAINETVADMVSRELGRRIARELGIDLAPPGRPEQPRPSDVEFRSMLRTTRTTLDGLLAQGRVDEAEAYLRQRQQELQAAGFQIRKLNQAYFAFYGSYGDAAAGVSPIPRQLGWLRAASGSPGEFLKRVSRLTSAEDLARAVSEP
jgi:hypothetical protein